MKLVIRPEADHDLADAYLWYVSKSDDLAQRLKDDFEDLLNLIQSMPHGFPKVYGEIRKARLHTFPYYVHFLVKDETIFVLSVTHTKRHPDVWKRLPRNPSERG